MPRTTTPRLAIAAFLLAALSGSASAIPGAVDTLEEARALAAASGKYILVDTTMPT